VVFPVTFTFVLFRFVVIDLLIPSLASYDQLFFLYIAAEQSTFVCVLRWKVGSSLSNGEVVQVLVFLNMGSD